MQTDTIAVIGAGSWGTTIAQLLAAKIPRVQLWSNRTEIAEGINSRRQNELFLPGIPLRDNIHASAEMAETVRDARLIIWAIPVQFLRLRVQQCAPHIGRNAVFINLGKGIEEKTWARPSEILMQEFPAVEAVGSLVGPNIAIEVAQQMFSEATLALSDFRLLDDLQELLTTPAFQVRGSADLIGLELAGALKNVVALAAGICDGAKTGVNTKGLVIARGLAEMRRIGVALGANPESFLTGSTLGDLLATCFSANSRNRRLGELLAHGHSLDAARDLLQQRIAEGISTCHVCAELEQRLKLKLPVMHAVYLMLRGEQDAAASVHAMTRQASAH